MLRPWPRPPRLTHTPLPESSDCTRVTGDLLCGHQRPTAAKAPGHHAPRRLLSVLPVGRPPRPLATAHSPSPDLGWPRAGPTFKEQYDHLALHCGANYLTLGGFIFHFYKSKKIAPVESSSPRYDTARVSVVALALQALLGPQGLLRTFTIRLSIVPMLASFYPSSHGDQSDKN